MFSRRELFPGMGQLQYRDDGWVTLKVNDSIGNYYRYWIARYTHQKPNTPLYGDHITVIAGKYEDVRKHHAWKRYDGQNAGFLYDSYLMDDELVFWLGVISPRLEQIRLELGLRPTPKWPFHLTIANLKNIK